ncbi:universal stress protein [Phenylobacterium immobile]|uniref:universal stress protein n=1 Tax=Phenylobacterium immobile TaxID=21 RepID=UPI000B1E02D6|nr:universal stress protein [Phenylobacterium immobile]
MSWANIMAPLSGRDDDKVVLDTAAALASAHGANLVGVFTPPDVASVTPWIGDNYMGVAQASAIESLQQAAAAGEQAARATFGESGEKRRFVALDEPIQVGLAAFARLSDVVVFTDASARGRGPLSEAFQQILVSEQRPVYITRGGYSAGATIAVAWDGGKEASRAARLALPLLESAGKVVLLSAPAAITRQIDPEALQAYYAARGVQSEVKILASTGEVAPALLQAAQDAGADVLVAGAFGHSRLQEFIFGGSTRTFLNTDGPSLFLSH